MRCGYYTFSGVMRGLRARCVPLPRQGSPRCYVRDRMLKGFHPRTSVPLSTRPRITNAFARSSFVSLQEHLPLNAPLDLEQDDIVLARG